jgi:hypothetical protein
MTSMISKINKKINSQMDTLHYCLDTYQITVQVGPPAYREIWHPVQSQIWPQVGEQVRDYLQAEIDYLMFELKFG